MRTKLNNIRFNEKDKCIEFEYGGQTFHYDIKEIEKSIITSWNNQYIIDELEKWFKKQINYLTKIDGQNIPLKDGFEFCSMNELYQTGKYSGLKDSLNKLQELKGSDFNE